MTQQLEKMTCALQHREKDTTKATGKKLWSLEPMRGHRFPCSEPRSQYTDQLTKDTTKQ